jgi:hypothetical protein
MDAQQIHNTKLQNNRAAVKRFYDRNRAKILFARIRRRVQNGAVPQRLTLEKTFDNFNVTEEMVNKWRKDAHRETITYDLYPVQPKRTLRRIVPTRVLANGASADGSATRINASHALPTHHGDQVVDQDDDVVSLHEDEIDTPTDDAVEINQVTGEAWDDNVFTLQEAYNAIMGHDKWKGSGKNQSTKDQYKSRITRVYEWFNHHAHNSEYKELAAQDRDLVGILQATTNEQADKILWREAKTNGKDYLNIIIVLQNASKKYKRLMTKEVLDRYAELGRKYKQQSERAAGTRVDTREVIPLKKLQEAATIVAKKFPYSNEHLITAVYSEVALRDDLGNARILPSNQDKPSESTGNWYSVKSNTLFLRDFKNARVRGETKTKFSTTIKNIVQVRLKNGTCKYGYWLVPQRTDPEKQYAKGVLSQHITKAFERSDISFPVKPGVDQIRYAFVSDLLTVQQAPVEQREALATKMMSSVQLQFTVYNRLNTSSRKIVDKIMEESTKEKNVQAKTTNNKKRKSKDPVVAKNSSRNSSANNNGRRQSKRIRAQK